MRRTALTVLCVLLLTVSAEAKKGDTPEKLPGKDTKGELCSWKAKDGLVFRHRMPKSFDADKGVNLTLILHGSNLDGRWGFANHAAKSFRPDDLVVSPDGTTSNGRGGFNFLGEKKDAKRLHALIDELKQLVKINAIYLYGHSQGSFFALYYAGEYPEDVNGVVAHASGVWTWTKQSKKGHHQAIVLMHGTQDPVVPYGQSEGGWESYLKKAYPIVRLRSLEGWNHWPSEHNLNMYNQAVPHTSQQLAWVEGMTTEDPERLEASFAFLAANKFKERHDYAGTYLLAKRVAAHDAATDTLKARATKVAAAIEALAQKHAEELTKALPSDFAFEKKPWVAHLVMFLRTFNGVPACDALFEAHARALKKDRDRGIKHFTAYWKATNKGDSKKAFEAGVKALEQAFLYHQTADYQFRKNMKDWSKASKTLGLAKKTLKKFGTLMKDFEKAQELGMKAFDKLNKKHGKLP